MYLISPDLLLHREFVSKAPCKLVLLENAIDDPLATLNTDLVNSVTHVILVPIYL